MILDLNANIEIIPKLEIYFTNKKSIELEDYEYIQDLHENYNIDLSIQEEFNLSRGWWFNCKICEGRSFLKSSRPACQHCGFQQKNNRRTK